MFKSFKLPRLEFGAGKDPRVLVRAVLGVLLAANVVAALVLFKPWGGSPEDLAIELDGLRRQVQQQQAALQRSRALVAKVETARSQGDGFLNTYFAEQRGAYGILLGELTRAAQGAGVKPKEHSFASELIEGSDNLEMVTITGNYEGNYGDLIRFINSLDRSPRFIILEQLNAAPQQASGLLNINIRMHCFVRNSGVQPAFEPPPQQEERPEPVAEAPKPTPRAAKTAAAKPEPVPAVKANPSAAIPNPQTAAAAPLAPPSSPPATASRAGQPAVTQQGVRVPGLPAPIAVKGSDR